MLFKYYEDSCITWNRYKISDLSFIINLSSEWYHGHFTLNTIKIVTLSIAKCQSENCCRTGAPKSTVHETLPKDRLLSNNTNEKGKMWAKIVSQPEKPYWWIQSAATRSCSQSYLKRFWSSSSLICNNHDGLPR